MGNFIDQNNNNNAFSDFVNIFGVKENKQVEIFIYIMKHTNPETNVFIGTYKKISQDVKCSETTIAKIMKKLQETNVLKKIQNGVWQVKSDFTDNNSNVASLLIHVTGDEPSKFDHIQEKTQKDTQDFSLTKSNDTKQEDDYGQDFEIEIVNPKITLKDYKYSKDDVFYKVDMANPIVELNGDEMTRIIWDMVKQELILPFVNLNTIYYDLGIVNRDYTNDQVTIEAADAIKRFKVGVKCATITPNLFRQKEYNLKRLYKSPNGTIRERLDGTVFRTPILVDGIKPVVSNWKKPITIARHAYGDLYSALEKEVNKPGDARLFFEDRNQNVDADSIFSFTGPGVIQCQYNTEDSVEKFARSCFNFALDSKQDLWFSAKDTISKKYDQMFKEIFDVIYVNEYKTNFEQAGINFFYTLIDDAVARVMRSEGGMIWALKNYDGDVMSDMVASAFGALAMMTSVLVSPDGCFEYEAAHGTVQKHYYKYQNGESTSTNSVATIFAWAGALKKRGQLDNNNGLIDFGDRLMWATKTTIESGKMTNDLAQITTIKNPIILNTEEFIMAVKENMGVAIDPLFSDHSQQTIKSYPLKAQKKLMNSPVAFSYYNDFFDTNLITEKIEIVKQSYNYLTDEMIDDFASSMDLLVWPNSDIIKRRDDLITQMISKAKFTDVIVNE